MRKRFEQQLTLGQLSIEDTYISPKSRYAIDELLAALKETYCNKEYNEKIFSILGSHINYGKKKTGRPGMDLRCIFVLAQVRLCLDMSYEGLHHHANNNHVMRRVMEGEQDQDIVIELADRILPGQKVLSWSFDKGFWRKDNKELLQSEIPQVVMPKLVKRNKKEETEENSSSFNRLT